jgi:pantothenate kinase
MDFPAETWQRLSHSHFYLDRSDTRLELDYSQVEQFYFPLVQRLLASLKPDARLLVSVAGIPGSGKTAFSTLLTGILNAHCREDIAVLIGQDGWHYPNAYLDSHTLHFGGEEVTLRSIKGAPESYDTTSAYSCLLSIRQQVEVSFPVYDRTFHDPIPHAGHILKSQRIIIVEGNYWLLDEDPWRSFYPLFDLHILLSADTASLVDGLRQRHLKGGKTPQTVEEHIRRVDFTNAARILQHLLPPDIIVHKADSFRISRIE